MIFLDQSDFALWSAMLGGAISIFMVLHTIYLFIPPRTPISASDSPLLAFHDPYLVVSQSI
jgi:hypothetical protein